MKQQLLLYGACLIAASWRVAPAYAVAAQAEAGVAQAPPTARFAAEAAVVSEDEGRTAVAVTLSAPPRRDTEVTVSVTGGTAAVGEDVSPSAQSTTLTFQTDAAPSQQVVFTVHADQESEGVEFLDLTLTSAEASVGDGHSFRLWIRDPVLYPDLRAGALTERLRADFGPATLLDADQVEDTLLSVVWNTAGAVRGVFTETQAVISSADDPRAAAHKQGVAVDYVWPKALEEAARRDLHLFIPLDAEVKTARQREESFLGADEEVTDETAPALQPREAMKGDLARALLYFYALYPDQADMTTFDRLRPVLARWMETDPVDDAELRRNALIARYQETPNPFVVAPDLVESAFNLRDTYPTPTVSFVRSGASVSEADSVAVIEVAVTGMGDGDDVTFDLVLDEEAGTVDGDDLPGFRRRTVTFPAGAPDGTVRRIRVPVARDDLREDTEQASFGLENLSGFARAGEAARYTLNVENAVPPSQEQDGRVTLGPPYPNPLSPGRGSTVRFDLTMDEPVPFSVEVFSTLGQRVHANSYSAGEAEQMSVVEIDGEDLPSGLYIVRLRGPSFSITETFVVVR